MQKQTPGPWQWVNLGGQWHLCRCDNVRTVVMTTVVEKRHWDGDSPETVVLAVRDEGGRLVPLTPDHPDARLIVAAPDLAEGLEMAIRWLRRLEQEHPGCLNGDAISKHLQSRLGRAKGG